MAEEDIAMDRVNEAIVLLSVEPFYGADGRQFSTGCPVHVQVAPFPVVFTALKMPIERDYSRNRLPGNILPVIRRF
jgi:hypothetical protein